MESIKLVLEFNSPLLQVQGVATLERLVKEKLEKHGMVGFNTTHQVPELDYLLSMAIEGATLIAEASQTSLSNLICLRLISLEGCLKQIILTINAVARKNDAFSVMDRRKLAAIFKLVSKLMNVDMSRKMSGNITTKVEAGHPLAVILQGSTPCLGEFVVNAFNDSICQSTIYFEKSEQNADWSRLLDYHKPFLEFIFREESSLMSHLVCHVILSCFSKQRFLNESLTHFLPLLTRSHDISSVSMALYLDTLWTLCKDSWGTLDHVLMSKLVKFTLASLCLSPQSSEHTWLLCAEYCLKVDIDLTDSMQLLAKLINCHMASSYIVVEALLSIAQQAIKRHSRPQRNILLMPMLQLIACMESVGEKQNPLLNQANNCLQILDQTIAHMEEAILESGKVYDSDVYLNQLDEAELLAPCSSEVFLSDAHCMLYLASVQQQLALDGAVSPGTLYMLAALLVHQQNKSIQINILNIFKDTSLTQPSQVSGILLFMAHWLSRPLNPEVVLAALNIIPALGINKFNMAAVFKYLEKLTKTSKSKALSIKLLCDLSKEQSRAFPRLISVINTITSNASLECTVAKLFAVNHICDLRPELYCADVLPIISEALDPHSNFHESVVCLAFQSLYLLVQAEVVDLKTIWDVLSDTWMSEQRVNVLACLCDLLSLSSSIADTGKPEQKDFKEKVVTLLWVYTSHQNVEVSCSAYKALSSFPFDSIHYRHLPQHIALTFAPDYAEQQEDYDSKPVEVQAFISLLQNLRDGEESGFEVLLSTYLQQEVDRFGVAIAKIKTRSKRNVPKAIQELPRLLNKSYMEQLKDPREDPIGNSAIAVLLCQQTTELKKNASASEMRQCISASRQLTDQMTGLIRRCYPVSHNNYEFNYELLTAWTVYMKHILMSVINARISEAKLSNQSLSHWEAIFRAKDLVETSVITSPNSNDSGCNTFLALTALAVAVRQQCQTTEENAGGEKEMPTPYIAWEINTIKALLSVAYKKPNRDLLPWLTHSINNTHLVACWISLSCFPIDAYKKNESLMQEVLEMFHHNLTLSFPDYEFLNCNYYMALLLRFILKDCQQDSTTEKTADLIWRCVNILLAKPLSLLTKIVYPGVEEIIPSLLLETNMIEKIKSLFYYLELNPEGQQPQVLAVRARIASHLFSAQHFTEVNRECDMLFSRYTDGVEISSALGGLVHKMMQEFHPSGTVWFHKLQERWLDDAKSKDDNAKLCAIEGLFSLVGLHFNQTTGEMEMSNEVMILCEKLADVLCRINRESETKCFSWHLACMYHMLSDSQLINTYASSPHTYKHSLPNDSFLRNIVEQLYLHIKATNAQPAQILMLVRCIKMAAMRKQLPQLHWPTLLTPLLRLRCAEATSIQQACLLIAMSQSKSCPLSASFITKWCSFQLFRTLDVSVQEVVFSHVPKFLNCMEPERSAAFRDKIWLTVLQQENSRTSVVRMMTSLKAMLEKVGEYKPAVIIFIYQTVKDFLKHLNYTSANYLEYVRLLSECLRLCEDSLTHDIIKDDKLYIVTRFHVVRSLVGSKCSIHELTTFIDAIMKECDTEWLVTMLSSCWKSLTALDIMHFIMDKLQGLQTEPDSQRLSAWLHILSSVVVVLVGGRQCQEPHRVFSYHLKKFLLNDTWKQISVQVKKQLTALSTKENLVTDWKNCLREIGL